MTVPTASHLVRAAVCAVSLLTVSPAARAHGRTPPIDGANRLATVGVTPVAIVAVDEFRYRGTEAVIVRRANMSPHDVIVVKRAHVTPRFLADAVFTLRVVRSAYGDTPAADAVYQVQPRARAGKRTTEAAGWANTLVTTRANEVEGYGPVKHVTLYIPNSARK